MLLSNTAIYEALDDGRLVVKPEPSPRYPSISTPKTPYDSTAVNLTLGNVLRIPKDNMSISLDVPGGNITETLKQLCKEKVLDNSEAFELKKGTFILGNTREYIHLPRERKSEWGTKPLLAARVEGKSSFARVGILVHFTAPTIHCGFEGTITLEIICLGNYSVLLKPGMQICQLLVEEVSGDPSDYVSQFQAQTKPEGK
ncbi:dCTP deaminase [soil metagenome]